MSLFNKPKKQLCPELFTENEQFRQNVRLYIFDDINKILTPGIVVGIYILGSSVGRQYDEDSDIDLNLILRKGLDRINYKEYVKKYNGRLLPGTNHIIKYHVQNNFEPNFADSEYAIYDLVRDTWAIPPKKYEDILDPEQEFKKEIAYAKMYAKTISASDKVRIFDKLINDRKDIYRFGWGTPRELQQNILYKFVEKAFKTRLEDLK